MKTCLLMFTTMMLLASGCASTHRQTEQMPVVYVDDFDVDGIVLHAAHCTPEYVKSILGPPKYIDYNGQMRRYPDLRIDFWFSRDGRLSEIHLNPGFEGRLNSGISMSSTKQEVFRAYGKPDEEKEAPDLHRKNDDRVLYKKGNLSRIYYSEYGLIFWFKGNAIAQIIPLRGMMSRGAG